MRVNYCCVFRIGDHFYLPRRDVEVWGTDPDAIWTFGKAQTKTEQDLRDAINDKIASGKCKVKDFPIPC